jgi:replicative DNA helicase
VSFTITGANQTNPKLKSNGSLKKHAIAVNRFAKQAARYKKWVNIFSLEMDDISLAERLVIGAFRN